MTPAQEHALDYARDVLAVYLGDEVKEWDYKSVAEDLYLMSKWDGDHPDVAQALKRLEEVFPEVRA